MIFKLLFASFSFPTWALTPSTFSPPPEAAWWFRCICKALFRIYWWLLLETADWLSSGLLKVTLCLPDAEDESWWNLNLLMSTLGSFFVSRGDNGLLFLSMKALLLEKKSSVLDDFIWCPDDFPLSCFNKLVSMPKNWEGECS